VVSRTVHFSMGKLLSEPETLTEFIPKHADIVDLGFTLIKYTALVFRVGNTNTENI